VRHYLKSLEDVTSGHSTRESDYDWMMLELFDQTVRGSPGGEMKSYLTDPALSNKDFIISRIGIEAERIWTRDVLPRGHPHLVEVEEKNLAWFVNQLRIELACMLVMIIAGIGAKKSFREGLFRDSGEIHRWMYDRFSLKKLLTKAGFIDVRLCRADESRIPSFNSYSLDVLGKIIRKPDSIYMEAVKP